MLAKNTVPEKRGGAPRVNPAAIIPSLNPDETLLGVVDGLVAAGFSRIYIVNDGSAAGYRPLFEQAASRPGCVLLCHDTNKGKGRALKTAFARYLQDAEGLPGVVTMDGDGQHRPADVARVAAEMALCPGALVLGARSFAGAGVPARSAWGNTITRGVFRLLCGISVRDTQTGLRGIPHGLLPRLLAVGGDRYDYETNMLLEMGRSALPMREISIETIYLNNNAASHFHAVRDSFRIYSLILRFSLLKFFGSSLLSALVDYLLFTLLFYVAFTGASAEWRLFAATAIARFSSALFNFFLNKRLVFASRARTGGAMGRYAALCVVQMLCSYGGAYALSVWLPVPTWLAKFIADTLLFFISYVIQRQWVFRPDGQVP